MIIHVANPIYDSVFKYLMEDERIAKTILSALLKKEVIHVTVRPHEYSNTTRDTLSMFRIDFAATVREREGGAIKDRIVLIELQKTWLNTETLRFRQYLGAQYSNKNNMREADEKGFAYPMVAVYLLGHKVGNIKEPIVYVNHDVFDYNGNVVADVNEEPFVESLTHNSIIVQIPLLHGNVNNRLEKVLSVFDQTQVEGDTQQVLKIDEDKYADDSDMLYVLHKLTAAAANSEMRQDMNVEDEYYKAIEDRDTAIMQRDKMLKEQEQQLSQQSEQLSQQSEQLSQQSEQLSQQSEQLSQQSEQLSQQSEQLSQQSEQLSQQSEQLSQQSEQLSQQSEQLTLKDEQLRNMAKALFSKGMTEEQISTMTGISLENVVKLLK
ncbi:hypothetical protein [Prevotella pectinovora]|nr:hypothetical protein [Prevotella pectinovora]KIP56641.1 hypothetical protein ST41_06875 [Prevotella pectinovora]